MAARIIVFRGEKYELSEPGPYYRRYQFGKSGPSSLHRAKWEHYRGPIPEGFDIHHRDGDGTNNRLSNLEMVDRREHQREHSLEGHKQGKLKPPTKLARERAAEWHRSEEGRQWHVQHGKRTWERREWHWCECQECGRLFRSPYPKRAKFCHLNCKMTALRRRRGQPVGVRPNNRKPPSLHGKRNPAE